MRRLLAGLAVLGALTPVGATAAEPKQWLCGGKPATIVGTPGDDVIYGTKGDDFIRGLAGNDTIYGRPGFNRICAGPGIDKVHGGYDPDDIWGGPGNDILVGHDDANQGDYFWPGPGNDRVNGGAASCCNQSVYDAVFYSGADRGVVVDVTRGDGTATGQGRDTLLGIDGVIGTEYDDVIRSAGGWSYGSIYALGGDDLLYLGGDFHRISGGDGDDTFWVTNGWTEDGADGGNGHDVWNLCEMESSSRIGLRDLDSDYEVHMDRCPSL